MSYAFSVWFQSQNVAKHHRNKHRARDFVRVLDTASFARVGYGSEVQGGVFALMWMFSGGCGCTEIESTYNVNWCEHSWVFLVSESSPKPRGYNVFYKPRHEILSQSGR